MNSQEIIEQIENEIARLQQVKALLQGSNSHAAPRLSAHLAQSVSKASAAPAAGKVKRVLSEQARKKIAAAQRRRWAKAKRAQAK